MVLHLNLSAYNKGVQAGVFSPISKVELPTVDSNVVEDSYIFNKINYLIYTTPGDGA